VERLVAGATCDFRLGRILADLSTIVGALLLSRATAGDPLSEAILVAARHRLG
jgi:hypothetical protein